MHPPRALLLDLDGTLCDTLPDLAEAVNHIRGTLAMPPVPPQALRPFLGDGAKQLLAGAVGVSPEHAATLVAPFRAYYLPRCSEGTSALPGAADLVREAARLGLGIAVVTNKPREPAERILEALGMLRHVRAVVGGECLPTRKPDPAMVHEALRLLGGPAPRDAWLVGDSAQDVAAAKAAGCAAVLVRGYGDLEKARAEGPDLEVGDLRELLPRLGATLPG
jgi:2-phosphoglycolate phosphatase